MSETEHNSNLEMSEEQLVEASSNWGIDFRNEKELLDVVHRSFHEYDQQGEDYNFFMDGLSFVRDGFQMIVEDAFLKCFQHISQVSNFYDFYFCI
jgi:hypothetical protein